MSRSGTRESTWDEWPEHLRWPASRLARQPRSTSPAPRPAQPSVRSFIAQDKGEIMSTNNTYLAVFLGSKTSPRRAAWDALPEGDRRAKEREGMAAWKAWVEKHQ